MSKLVKFLLVVSLLGMTGCKQTGNSAKSVDLENDKSKFSYALGLEIGGSLKRLNTDIDIDAFVLALTDTLKGGTAKMTGKEAMEIKQTHFKGLQDKQKLKNTSEGETFLEKNKGNKGVITTESGLQYIVLSEGTGPKALKTDKVSVHYKGTLIDGTEFDSSHKRGKPAEFSVTGVIPGWTEALQLMNVGSKFKVFIPSKLAYGERGAGAQIGPNSTLIFEMELLEIKAK